MPAKCQGKLVRFSTAIERVCRLLLIWAVVCVAALSCASSAYAQEASGSSNNSQLLLSQNSEPLPADSAAPLPQSGLEQTCAGDDNTLFFAYLKDSEKEVGGPLYDFLKEKQFFKDVLIPVDSVDRKFRPMLQMRFWWDSPQKFVPAIAFCTLIAWVCWFLLPEKLTKAQAAIRAGFWRCFLSGFFCATVWLLCTRAVFLTHVGWPLGIVSTGLFQAGLLLGLSVIISMIGHAFCVLARVGNRAFVATRPQVIRVIELLIGSICCAGIMMLPTPDPLPHATMRLLFLFAVLGLGAFCKVFKEKDEATSV